MSANDRQIGGEHYISPIQPWNYISANGLDFFEGTIIDYVSRWRTKGGIEDLRKASGYLEKLIELSEANAENGE